MKLKLIQMNHQLNFGNGFKGIFSRLIDLNEKILVCGLHVNKMGL